MYDSFVLWLNISICTCAKVKDYSVLYFTILDVDYSLRAKLQISIEARWNFKDDLLDSFDKNLQSLGHNKA